MYVRKETALFINLLQLFMKGVHRRMEHGSLLLNPYVGPSQRVQGNLMPELGLLTCQVSPAGSLLKSLRIVRRTD